MNNSPQFELNRRTLTPTNPVDFPVPSYEIKDANHLVGIQQLSGIAIELTDRFPTLSGRHKLNPLLGDKLKPIELGFTTPHQGRHHISKPTE